MIQTQNDKNIKPVQQQKRICRILQLRAIGFSEPPFEISAAEPMQLSLYRDFVFVSRRFMRGGQRANYFTARLTTAAFRNH